MNRFFLLTLLFLFYYAANAHANNVVNNECSICRMLCVASDPSTSTSLIRAYTHTYYHSQISIKAKIFRLFSNMNKFLLLSLLSIIYCTAEAHKDIILSDECPACRMPCEVFNHCSGSSCIFAFLSQNPVILRYFNNEIIIYIRSILLQTFNITLATKIIYAFDGAHRYVLPMVFLISRRS